jgi:hypothetical protein
MAGMNARRILGLKMEETASRHGGKLKIRKCIQKFPDWSPGARTANGAALCH